MSEKEFFLEAPSSLRVHRAAALFPMMEGPGLNDLVADIRLHGLREPIVVLDGELLDGRNRLKACEMAEVRPRFTEWDRAGSVVDWVFSVNLHRRHLTLAQRALLVARQLELRALETRERTSVNSQLPGADPGCARTKAADQAEVGESSVRHAQILLGKGVPELLARVEAGDVSLSTAAQVASLPPQEQRDVVREGREMRKAAELRKPRAPGSLPPAIPSVPVAPPRREILPAGDAHGTDEPEDVGDSDDDADEDPSAGYFAKPPVPRPVELSSFQVRHSKGTTRAEEAGKVDELANAASSALHALTWMLIDWEKRAVWDMDFAKLDAGEISQHLLLASTKLEAWADVCHGRKKAPTRQGY